MMEHVGTCWIMLGYVGIHCKWCRMSENVGKCWNMIENNGIC